MVGAPQTTGNEQARVRLSALGGAGRNLAEASRPCVFDRDAISFGWLGYVCRDTMPSHIASGDRFGTNPLDRDRAADDVAALRERVGSFGACGRRA